MVARISQCSGDELFLLISELQKMTASSSMPTLEVSNAIRRLTMEETRDLMFQMGVPLNVLKDIAEEFKGEYRKQNFAQMWLDMKPDASWEKLVAGLRKINKNALAVEIESDRQIKAARAGDTSLLKPAVDPVQPTDPRVEEAKENIERLEKEFSDIKFETKRSLAMKEKEDSVFLDRFRDHLLDLPVSKKQIHVRFFTANEEEIFEAETIRKLFVILGRYCNYFNYEIIFHVVKRFCYELNDRMMSYRDSLTSFEKATTVDVYLCAISARPGGGVSKGFIQMTTKINKLPSACTLYEIRELKEAIEEEASLYSFATYIDAPGKGSIQVVLHVHVEVGWMVGVVFTLDFRRKHLLTDVTVDEKDLREYLVS